MFSIFINDAQKKTVGSKVPMYADDLKLFRPIETVLDRRGLQKVLDSLVTWSDKNHLSLNAEKCSTIMYTRNARLIDTHRYKINIIFVLRLILRAIRSNCNNKLPF